MARHGGNQQNAAFHRLAASNAEMDQIAKGAFDHGFDMHDVIPAVGAGVAVDAPIGFDRHALE